LAPSRQSLFAGLDYGCGLVMFLLQMFVISVGFEAPILRRFWYQVLPKKVLEKNAKNRQKEVCE
jgi:hypothetical protein